MNYRHHFHAGNFADVMKHALWLQLLARLTQEAAPLRVTDTHAGTGLYDLQDAMARRSKEADAGVGRLMADEAAPLELAPLKAAVGAANPDGALRWYPGSPLLTASALRREDAYLGCELRADDQQALETLLVSKTKDLGPRVEVALADGYGRLAAPSADRRSKDLYLIDPPFERSDEYVRLIEGVTRALKARPDTVFAIWSPLKDLETFDALLRGLERLHPPSLLVAEARLRPLFDPMKMNGSAMLFIGAPDLEPEAKSVCDWVVRSCGEAGGAARVMKLGR